jgi:glycosyltransferase involved in cell wall biosynthesis
MKVAVYTIALNEEQFVKRWAESAKDADYLLIADTGSTDRTIEIATSLGINVINVSVSPWRFDDARNSALHALPIDVDYCVALDMDEVLLPGWKKELGKALKQGVTRPRYTYTWSWNEDGTPGLQYGGDKIHARKGYRWKHPVHEVITADRTVETQGWYKLEIHHYPDNTKSRGQYLPLLELSVKEDPHDDRNAFYFARELYFNNMLEAAAAEFRRHLSLPSAVWAPERAASYRYLAKCEPNNAEMHLKEAFKVDPNRREQRVELANFYHDSGMWEECYEQVMFALYITEKPLDYLVQDFAWTWLPHDLAAISAWWLGKKTEAIDHERRALEFAPNDERMLKNLEFMISNSK